MFLWVSQSPFLKLLIQTWYHSNDQPNAVTASTLQAKMPLHEGQVKGVVPLTIFLSGSQ